MVKLKVALALLFAGAMPLAAFDGRIREERLITRTVALPKLEANYDQTKIQSYLSDPVWKSFNTANGGQWFAQFDTLTQRPRRVFGGAIPWVPGAANSLAGSYSAALLEEKARNFITANAGLFGTSSENLRFVPEAAMGDRDGRFRVAAFDYYLDGVKVEGARLAFAVNNGNMIYWNSSNIAAVPAATRPAISAETAAAALLSHAGVSSAEIISVQPATLKLLPKNTAAGTIGYQLAWEYAFRLRDGQATWAGYVDAISGSALAFGDTNRYAAESCPTSRTSATGRVSGGIRQAEATDPEIVRSFPLVQVDTKNGPVTTTFNGIFSYAGGSVSSGMNGSFFDDFCVSCLKSESSPEPDFQSFVSALGHGRLAFGVGGKEVAGAFGQPTLVYGNGTSTVADRTAFYHTNVARLMAKKWVAFPWLETNVPVNVNINDVCNAFWNGQSTNFFRSGFGTATLFCRNTGEIRDVMQHEWGHGIDDNDGQDPGYSFALGLGDFGTGEAVGDHIALFVDHDPCIGQSFAEPRNTGDFIDPETGAKRKCNGVRDVDELRATRGTLSTTNALQKCPLPTSNPVYFGPLFRQGHCEGEIWGQAAWHLVHGLTTGRSYSTARLDANKVAMTYAGDPIGNGKDGSTNPGFGSDQGWTIYERLFYISRPLVATYAPSRFTALGTSAYDALMAADDTGDGLANGTPHAAYINDALVHHGMEEWGTPEGIPAVADSSNCPSVGTPTVTLTQSVDAASGTPSVTIGWTSVAGASGYRVYRTERRNDVFLEVGSASASTTSLKDVGVDNGVSYFYRVVALGGEESCYSGTGDVMSIRVAQPELRMLSSTIVDSPRGNNDGGLDAGERAKVFLRLENRGLANLSNVTATARSITPGVRIVKANVVSFGSIAAGGSAAGTSSFEIELENDYRLCGQTAVLILSIQSDQGCLVESFAIPVGNDGTSCVVFRDVHAQPTSVAITTDKINPGCGDGDNVPDPGETVEVAVHVNNTGTKPARNVTVTLTSDKAYLTPASPQSVTLASIGGSGVDTQLATFRLTVDRTAPFDDLATLTASVAADGAVNSMSIQTRVNRDKSPKTFSYDFETGDQGWISSDPVASWKRASAPTTGNMTTVFYSQYAPGTCNALTSPAYEFSSTSAMEVDVAALTEFDGHAYDGSDVQISIDGGKTWSIIEPVGGYPVLSAGTSCIPKDQPQYGGVQPVMTRYRFDLGEFAGSTGQLRVRFQADPLVEVPNGGVWIDNVVASNMLTPVPSVPCP
jgi:hypothetical protein